MDRECASLLPKVCEVLLDSGSSLPDDTSLEKLLDWFTGLLESGGALLEAHPCLLEFISAVVHKPSPDPGVVSFALKVCGLVAAAEDAFRRLQERSVLDLAFNHEHWHSAGLWEDPCVRVGWIQGLRKMLQHSEALSFFVQADLIPPLLQLQTDSSLFVVSAANQLLAHILLFFQPALPTRRNGVSAKRGDDVTPQRPEDDAGSSPHYAAVVSTISEYLKESLVTKDSRLRQCRQVLKVLVPLLAQAGPFLRDKLLECVADSLEELVSAGSSQLTLPLMDVILAAHRLGPDECVPDQRVGRLLSSMLSANKPPDLVHAAAAYLHRGHRDTVHTARAVRILLLPLDILTGHTLLDTNTADEAHRRSMAEQLKSKPSCISIVCACLTNVALMPADALPRPPRLIVAAVASLLSICSGCASSSPSGYTLVFRNVVGSGKVQKCALEAVARLSGSAGVQEELTEVFTVLIRYLSDPDSDPTVIHKSYQALVQWMTVCKDLSSVKDQLRQDLANVVRKRACDVRWEVRDSTLEFLGELAGVPRSPEAAAAAGDASDAAPLDSRCRLALLREALRDPESYVRASAIAALGQTLLAHGRQQGAALSQEQSDVVKQLLEILSQDTEGFARRAVVRYFIAWFSSRASHAPPPSPPPTSLSAVLSLGSADLDWEVKVHALELAELLLDEALWGRPGYGKANAAVPVHGHGGAESDLSAVLKRLVEQGVVSALLSGLLDCDRPVGLKACQLLISLRETVGPPSKDEEANATAVAEVTCELPGCGWGRDIRRILGMKDEEEVDERGEGEGGGRGGASVSVCEVLRRLGLDARMDVLSQSSDHVHNSPLSLLQDIVMSTRAAHSHADTQPGREVIVDCY